MFKKLIVAAGLLLSVGVDTSNAVVELTGSTQALTAGQLAHSARLRISTDPLYDTREVFNQILLNTDYPEWTNKIGLTIYPNKCTTDSSKPVAVFWSTSHYPGNFTVMRCVALNEEVIVYILRMTGNDVLYRFTYANGTHEDKIVTNPYGSSKPATCSSSHSVYYPSGGGYTCPVLMSTTNNSCTVNTGRSLFTTPAGSVYGHQWNDTVTNYGTQYFCP